MSNPLDLDVELFLFLNNLGNITFDNFWLWISNKWTWIPLYAIFLYLLYRNYQLKSLVFILIFIALGITASDQISTIFKYGIGRLRPCHNPELIGQIRIVSCGGNYGFYSAHASNTFFLVSFLSVLLSKRHPKLPIFLFLWAAVVSYSRIYLGVHYPFDLLMGGAMGFLLGGFFGNLSIFVINRQTV